MPHVFSAVIARRFSNLVCSCVGFKIERRSLICFERAETSEVEKLVVYIQKKLSLRYISLTGFGIGFSLSWNKRC